MMTSPAKLLASGSFNSIKELLNIGSTTTTRESSSNNKDMTKDEYDDEYDDESTGSSILSDDDDEDYSIQLDSPINQKEEIETFLSKNDSRNHMNREGLQRLVKTNNTKKTTTKQNKKKQKKKNTNNKNMQGEIDIAFDILGSIDSMNKIQGSQRIVHSQRHNGTSSASSSASSSSSSSLSSLPSEGREGGGGGKNNNNNKNKKKQQGGDLLIDRFLKNLGSKRSNKQQCSLKKNDSFSKQSRSGKNKFTIIMDSSIEQQQQQEVTKGSSNKLLAAGSFNSIKDALSIDSIREKGNYDNNDDFSFSSDKESIDDEEEVNYSLKGKEDDIPISIKNKIKIESFLNKIDSRNHMENQGRRRIVKSISTKKKKNNKNKNNKNDRKQTIMDKDKDGGVDDLTLVILDSIDSMNRMNGSNRVVKSYRSSKQQQQQQQDDSDDVFYKMDSYNHMENNTRRKVKSLRASTPK